jgi:hypothetical protein
LRSVSLVGSLRSWPALHTNKGGNIKKYSHILFTYFAYFQHFRYCIFFIKIYQPSKIPKKVCFLQGKIKEIEEICKLEAFKSQSESLPRFFVSEISHRKSQQSRLLAPMGVESLAGVAASLYRTAGTKLVNGQGILL